MATTTPTITVKWSPDARAMIDYFASTIRRFGQRADDPRIQEFCTGLHAMDATAILDHVQGAEPRDELMLIPGDELLRIIAKMRAVERAVFG